MKIDKTIKVADLAKPVERVLELAARKVRAIDRHWDSSQGAPVFTVEGKYTTRGWTEWTQGFQYGCAILAFDGTDDRKLLNLGRKRTVDHMATHVTHTGVHDHGFNNLSTYGNLRRLMRERRIPSNEWEMNFYEMAIKASGAVQASRWSEWDTNIEDLVMADDYIAPPAYVYSFNGPHSLFVDTMRTLRILCVAHRLGHVVMGENDEQDSLLRRAIAHAETTANYIVFKGGDEQTYDVYGRTAHEAIFNTNDGSFRCRSTQQGYSPFSTWTRGLAWAMLGFAEQIEFIKSCSAAEIRDGSGCEKSDVLNAFTEIACATCDHYVNDCTAHDGVPYWDDGAPGLAEMADWRDRESQPFNDHEPVDSSAAAIAAQGLIRLGHSLGKSKGKRYLQAGLSVVRTIFEEPYLSTKRDHQGLLLHSVYHRPNGWDHIPKDRRIPCGESSMWGDYHAIELAILIQRMARGKYMTFFD